MTHTHTSCLQHCLCVLVNALHGGMEHADEKDVTGTYVDVSAVSCYASIGRCTLTDHIEGPTIHCMYNLLTDSPVPQAGTGQMLPGAEGWP